MLLKIVAISCFLMFRKVEWSCFQSITVLNKARYRLCQQQISLFGNSSCSSALSDTERLLECSSCICLRISANLTSNTFENENTCHRQVLLCLEAADKGHSVILSRQSKNSGVVSILYLDDTFAFCLKICRFWEAAHKKRLKTLPRLIRLTSLWYSTSS